MKYINTTTLEVKELYEIRQENPQMSIPLNADLSSLGFAEVIETIQPIAPAYHKVIELPPVFNGVDYEQAWSVVPMGKEERNAYIYNLIDIKEREKIMPRILREATILQLETWALSKGYPLDQFRIANKGYGGLKDFDEEIQQLRSHLLP